MILLIAIFHALPILAVALLSGTKLALFITTVFMLVVAGATGSSDCFFVDAIAIAMGTIIGFFVIKEGD